jgi:hypothetical protein
MANETIEDPSSPLAERAQALVSQVKQRMEPVDAWIRTLARERPLVALAGALGIGYLVGRLIRRI